MRIVKLGPIREFWEKHPDAEQLLKAWLAEAQRADWRNPNEVKKSYANASIVGNNRVVFNIRGNTYRLIVAICYRTRYALVKFLGTHEEYDAVDAETVNLYGGES